MQRRHDLAARDIITQRNQVLQRVVELRRYIEVEVQKDEPDDLQVEQWGDEIEDLLLSVGIDP